MVDEIRVGSLVAISIVISITIIILCSFKLFFAAQSSPSQMNNSHITLDLPATSYISTTISSPSDPERILKDAYNSNALEEIDRCLRKEYYYFHGGYEIAKPFCADNMALLKKSCENPQTYIQACENEIFKSYLQHNVI
jgi:hypothetical protein